MNSRHYHAKANIERINKFIAQGIPRESIADRLGISLQTIRTALKVQKDKARKMGIKT